ncbi:hypothetical protein TNCV_4692621 [Trichonephila clavipes]|nr:hypothetical protein TNCV_4692621 [Trichonephila clavipes]
MRVWKQWTDEHRTTGNGRRKVTSTRHDRHLLRMAVNHPASSGSPLVYCYRCTNLGFVNSLPWLHCGWRAKEPLYRDPSHGTPSTAASAMD